MILYTVGPATSRSLSALVDAHLPHATIHGAETGNGENLAHYILDHYNRHHNSQRQQGTEEAGGGTRKLPLLFLVGEQRRDIIPKTLMDETGVLPAEERIGVEELVVYETRVREDFEAVFRGVVQDARGYIEGPVDGTEGEGAVWVVVFSPTGCDAMLRVLGLGNQGQNQGQSQGRGGRNVFIASIGPTTRDHLRSKYGFEPDVCAEKPSHEGVGAGINRFMERRKQDAL